MTTADLYLDGDPGPNEPPAGHDDPADGDTTGLPRLDQMTDMANARRLIHRHGHEYRWVEAWGVWLHWDGRRWARDTRGTIVEAAKGVARWLLSTAAQVEDHETRKRLVKSALAVQAAGRVDAMIRLARTEAGIPVDPDELDADHWVLNVANGVLDLRTGALLSHDPRRLITKLAPVDYDPAADAPRWRTFLEQILPDADAREFVTRWLGYTLTGDVSEHKIVFAFGAGANGKSTLLEAFAAVLGDYARQAAPDLLMRRREDPHPTGLADLHGARLVLATETAAGRALDEALVKRLTGGDRIKARHMHKDFFEFDPTHKLVVATNHRPRVEGTDHGIWRRIRLVPFTTVIADDDQDRHLGDKLAVEAPGILRWALDGCIRWHRHGGLTEPTTVLAATADYRAEMDVLGDFISDSCILLPGLSARAGDLYASYQRWCEAVGERPVSQRSLGTALTERGLERYRSNGHWWRGIGLRIVGGDLDERSAPAPIETADQGSNGPLVHSPDEPADLFTDPTPPTNAQVTGLADPTDRSAD